MNLRPAAPQDAPAAAALLSLSMAGFGDAMLGFGDRGRALRALEKLFALPDHRLSWQYATLAEEDSQTAGLLLAFPGQRLVALSRALGGQILAVYSRWEALRLLWQSLAMLVGKECERDEFYIANLAVAAAAQRRGIGRALVRHAEELARQAGFGKCSLIVDLNNPGAIHFYDRLGYRVVQIVHTPWMERRFHTPGYQRRMREIG